MKKRYLRWRFKRIKNKTQRNRLIVSLLEEYTQQEIAELANVSYSLVNHIKNRKFMYGG